MNNLCLLLYVSSSFSMKILLKIIKKDFYNELFFNFTTIIIINKDINYNFNFFFSYFYFLE